ncbi:MAG: hypothetical protein H7202_12700 [Pedobacter sp.]|nr:hypothetical protein [Pedobacter sp.]
MLIITCLHYISILESLEKTDQALVAVESMVTAQNFNSPELNTFFIKFLAKRVK